MRVFGVNKTLKGAGATISALLLMVGAAAPGFGAREDKDRPAPARREAPQREAPQREAPARSRPAESAPSRPSSTPNYTPAPRVERAPAYNPPARQEQAPAPSRQSQPSRESNPAPSYSPAPRQQETTPAYQTPQRTAPTPTYNAPARDSSPAPSYSPAPNRQQERTPAYQAPQSTTPTPSYNPNPAGRTPQNQGGFRRVEPAANSTPTPSGPMPGGVRVSGQPAQREPAGNRNMAPSNNSNFRLPPGQTTRNTDGTVVHRANDGRVIHMDNAGRVTTVDARGGGQIHYAPNGRPDRVVTRTGAVVINRPTGVRQIVVERPGNVQFVTNQRGQGYIQRPVVIHERTYVQRTYYIQNRTYVSVYRPYRWGGASYNIYTPVRYYRPAYYGWAYSPWSRPVYYTWGWRSSPWYGYYGPYFAPYPYYRGPVFWLTDFLFASTFEYAYDQRVADAYDQGVRDATYQQQAMSENVKQMVADEVQRQLAQERAEAQRAGNYPQDSGPGIFNDGASHALVVYNPIQANDGGMGCALTEGDVIGFEGNLTPGVEYANVRVLASKNRDCATGSMVGVSLQDILDMQNHLRETIDRGMGELQNDAGRGGLPALPPQANGAPINTPLAGQLGPADPNGAAELREQAQQVSQEEQNMLNEAGGQGDAQTPTVTLGMTMDQVRGTLGQPRRIVDLGEKRMYIYDDMKVIFIDGRVSDVQ